MVAFPDNCGILDGLAHLRGSERLLLDMVERPEVLDAMVERAIKAYFQSAEVRLDSSKRRIWAEVCTPGCTPGVRDAMPRCRPTAR